MMPSLMEKGTLPTLFIFNNVIISWLWILKLHVKNVADILDIFNWN